MSESLDELKRVEVNQFQEELAKTYFSTGSSKEEYSSQPKPAAKDKNNRNRNGLLLAIFLTLLIITSIAFLAFNRLTINVKITPVPNSGIDNSAYTGIVPFNKNGELNNDLVKHVVFYENAGNESAWGKDITVLSNEDISKKAVLGIDFVKPISLKEKILCFLARGNSGGEEFRIALRDNENNICYSKISAIENGWQKFIVDGLTAQDFIDAEKINHIDFEVNPAEKIFLNSSTIYLKDMYLAKQEGGPEK